jgi:citrate synthase
MSGWIERDEMLALLGVRSQTLYAYVSRKLMAARPDPADPRRSLYSRADADRLIARRSRGRRAAEVAENAIAWGEAILPTAISTVAGGRLFYRGRDAVELAETASLEDTAALLWGIEAFPAQPLQLAFDTELAPIAAAMSMLGQTAAKANPSAGRTLPSLVEESALLLRSIASALGADLGSRATIAAGFARRWRCDRAGAAALRTALVVMADHELNASTFAARVTASTGAPLAAAALAGLSALLGPAHGGAIHRVASLFDDAQRIGPARAIRERLARGEPIAGFGHPLYPDIDPRAAALLELVELPDALAELRRRAHAATGREPNVDFASAALAVVLGLPADAPFLLFAAARSAGWLAHGMEQALSGRLIRPRARYSGPPIGAMDGDQA